VAPAGTPQAIIDKLQQEISAIQDSPEVACQFAAEGAMRMSSAGFGAYMVAEMATWERVVREGGIKAE
jgi:tripartite-type tricarboxylate transporter receptor subunit TctC